MSKRKYYKNFNKKKRFNFSKAITITLCVCIVGTYSYINLKDSQFIARIKGINIVSSIKNISPIDSLKKILGKSDVITSNDISSELEKLEDEEEKEESKVVSVDDITVYTIQVASLDDKSDLKKIEEVMEEYKIPSSGIHLDNSEKIQVYSSFSEDKVRGNLDKTKTYFSDAFLTKIEVPMLSLEYTDSYSYMKNIADDLNDLLANYKEENEYWDEDKNNLKTYNEILTKRQSLVEDLRKQLEKIDYEKMNVFKKNLQNYLDSVEKNIVTASKDANEKKGYLSEGLLLSSIQDYYIFVNSLK